MEKRNYDSSENVLAHEGLHQLVQRGRALHDRAVLEALVSLIKLVCLPAKGCFSPSAEGGKLKFPGHKGAISRS